MSAGPSKSSPPPRVGIVYETFDAYAAESAVLRRAPDWRAEYEPEATIVALEAAFALLGCQTERVGTPFELLERIAGARASGAGLGFDAALCIAEGFGSRNREAWGPALLEMAGVPMLGSDALSLSLSLDKAWTHRHVSQAGVPVVPYAVFESAEAAGSDRLPAPFPLFVKPRHEGTAKGLRPESRVEDREALVREVARVVADYAQPALVEAFLDGPEYTVTVVGHDPPRALPVLQRALDSDTRIGIHALEGPGQSGGDRRTPVTPGRLEEPIEKELAALSLRVFAALECRDFARIDFKCDSSGSPYFLEINTLPTFDPEASFGILAELEGRPPEALLADVMGEALTRLGIVTERSEARGS